MGIFLWDVERGSKKGRKEGCCWILAGQKFVVGNVTSRKRSPKEKEEEEGRVIGGTCKVGQSFSFLRSNIILRNPICELGRRRVFLSFARPWSHADVSRRLEESDFRIATVARQGIVVRSSNKEYSPVAGEIDRDCLAFSLCANDEGRKIPFV